MDENGFMTIEDASEIVIRLANAQVRLLRGEEAVLSKIAINTVTDFFTNSVFI